MGTARRFAAALGIISFAFVAVTGIAQQSSLEWVLLRALVALILFTVVGFIVGLIGARLVQEVADKKLAQKVVAEGERLRAENEALKKKKEEEEKERIRENAEQGAAASQTPVGSAPQ